MNVVINSNLYRQASEYAKAQGLNLTTVIENFLVRFVGQDRASSSEQVVPDVVQSLLGAGDPISDEDLNARKAYQQYLEGKYK